MPKRTAATLKIRDEVAVLKRERTLDAAVDLFYDKGYENTTLDEVADRLGMTKPFVYANFGSKALLLAEICQRGVQAPAQALEAALARRKSPLDRLETFARDYVNAVLGRQKHIAIYVREEKNLDAADARRLGAMRHEFFGKMTQLLEKGVASGDFDIEDAHMAALGIGGAVTWATFWYRPDGRLAPPEIAETMAGLILGMAGARSPSGKVEPRRKRA